LFEKTGVGQFERISTEGLGVWRKSRPGAGVFRYQQRVRGLHRGAVYRAVVQYRWLGDDGEPILTARRKSRRCSQDAGLPNLRVADVNVKPGEVEGTAVYKVKIVNRGTAPAENVGIVLRVDGEVVDDVEVIEVLEPNEVQKVTFNGPVCHRQMRVVVDPKQLITESHEQDNVRDPSCL
jgi:CARDB